MPADRPDPALARDLTRPHHLPNLRPGRKPPDNSWLPRQRRGTTPQMIGRYPDFDVFDAQGTWDEATTAVVLARLRLGGSFQFFTPPEISALRVFCDITMAQNAEPRVPVAEMVDAKLAAGRLDGYQYAGMPDDRDTWRLVLAGLDEAAQSRYTQPAIAACDSRGQEAIVADLAAARLAGGSWDRLSVKLAWSVCMRMVLSAFYAHPWAWNEIGFGGPAYPRGYMRLGPLSTLEPFESAGATAEDPVRLMPEPGP
ncbi:MAG: gluconate 2-dehydrogenase subunit 3 family protein [Streptosporangiaceae bacterium]